jgi:transcriptional antiterminator RfaH
VFVGIDLMAQRWHAINSTTGVARLVCADGAPARVADHIVESLQTMQDARGFIALPARPRFQPGEEVRVVDGAFSSCLGLFEGMTDGERVAILLDLMGRKVRVLLNIDCIMAA